MSFRLFSESFVCSFVSECCEFIIFAFVNRVVRFFVMREILPVTVFLSFLIPYVLLTHSIVSPRKSCRYRATKDWLHLACDLVCLGHFNGPLIDFNGPLIWSVWGISMVHWSGLSGAFQWPIDLVCLGHFNGPLMADSLICRRHISSRWYFTGIVGNNKGRKGVTTLQRCHRFMPFIS